MLPLNVMMQIQQHIYTLNSFRPPSCCLVLQVRPSITRLVAHSAAVRISGDDPLTIE
ncbi:hypothetical protein GIB67_004352 [Kingdonia uniflora]|uniref:Uncharacterized protein n=1 Tax=Kingdonia uniflora TaxID=39325 RepID=A0A7J7MRD9_9MAGN|nr:hypothetical protein GIB67_004352 [Kingdonia uniflora]